MSSDKLRMLIAHEAARLLYSREESEYLRAKLKAARRLFKGDVKPKDLPSNAEIRERVQSFASLYEGEERKNNLREMRVAALRMMKILDAFRPRLIGSVLTGHVRNGSDIDLHVFADSLEPVTSALDLAGHVYTVQRKRVKKDDIQRTYTHVHVDDVFPFELTLCAANQVHVVTKSSITGKSIERVSINELEQLLAREYPDINLEEELLEAEHKVDRFQIYEMLLLPLEHVKQDPRYHPEGDVLYHSLQVFTLAEREQAYDEEFLLAALLHDVGKGIDPSNHVQAGLEALEGYITERTKWLIEHHMEAHQIFSGTCGQKLLHRLQADENYADLMLLEECDRRGREKNVAVPELSEVIETLRELSRQCDM